MLQGLRQSGKTSFLEHVSPNGAITRLDDLSERRLADQDPALFLRTHPERPLIIDEAQYAPNLFPEIKLAVDAARRARLEGGGPVGDLFFLSGSNQTLLHGEVRETLAGRASIFTLHTLSIREILRSRPDYDVFEYLVRGGWPELQTDRRLPERAFLDDYVATFLEKDIARSAGIEKLRAFETALGLLAARTGQQLNVSEIAGQAGVDASTLTGWISVLERNRVVSVLQPFHSNLSKRLVKTPKIYFLEPSLATRLQGWSELGPLLRSPLAGPAFETLVHGEIVRTVDHGRWSVGVHFLRSREGDEIDFLVSGPNSRQLLIEAKLGVHSVGPVALSSELAKVVPRETEAWVVSPASEGRRLSATSEHVPVARLADRLEEWLGSG